MATTKRKVVYNGIGVPQGGRITLPIDKDRNHYISLIAGQEYYLTDEEILAIPDRIMGNFTIATAPVIPTLDDTSTDPTKTWSSTKISSEINNQIGNLPSTSIDDTVTNVSKTWSSTKISSQISAIPKGDIGASGPQGPKGDPGNIGSQGPVGPAGTNGANGSVWLNGSGVPSSGIGSNKDYYLDVPTGIVYQKSSGAWSQIGNIKGDPGLAGTNGINGTNGTNGTNGINGATWLNGPGVPSAGSGINNDYYLNATTGDVSQKQTGTWTTIGNIKGSLGATGSQGTQGTQGIPGATGPQGPQGPQGVPGAAGGTVVGTYKNRPLGMVSVTEFGAKGDGTTNDLTVINNAVAACLAGETLYFPAVSGNGYVIDTTLTIAKKINVIMDSPVYYTGTVDEPAIVYGTVGSNNQTTNVNLKLQAIRSTKSNWLSEANIGIKIISVQQSNIEIFQAQNFTIGAQILGDGAGFTGNNFKLGLFYNNKIGLDLVQQNAGGYVTENVYIGGSFRQQSNTNTTLSRYGVRIRRADTIQSWPLDHNTFLKPHFELVLGTAPEAVPVLIDWGDSNEFLSCRNESNSATFARITNSSRNNVFDLMGSAPIIEENGTDVSSVVTFKTSNIYKQKRSLVFNSGNLREKACYYDGATNVHIAGVHLAKRIDGNTYVAQNGISLANPDYVEFNNPAGSSSTGIGVFIDTKIAKRFIVNRDCENTYGSDIAIIPYDSSGNLFTGASDPGVIKTHFIDYQTWKWETNASLAWTGQAYGSYRTIQKSNNDFFFWVGPTVSKVRVILFNFSNGVDVMRIRSFSIYTADPHASSSAWIGYEQGIPNANIATTFPTAGTWNVGKRIYQAAPASGQSMGWINTRTGTSAPIWVASKAYALNDLIVPTTDNGHVYKCTVAGTSNTSQPTWTIGAGATQPTDGTVTWVEAGTAALFKTMGTLP